jgi:hypothetical protein
MEECLFTRRRWSGDEDRCDHDEVAVRIDLVHERYAALIVGGHGLRYIEAVASRSRAERPGIRLSGPGKPRWIGRAPVDAEIRGDCRGSIVCSD